MGDRILAITVYQPWASLIAHGHKTIETRPAPPNGPMTPVGVRGYPGRTIDRGQRIAIHAGGRPFGIDSPQADAVRSLPLESYRLLRDQLGHGDVEHGAMGGYPLMAVVATAVIVDALPIVEEDGDPPFACLDAEAVPVIERYGSSGLRLWGGVEGSEEDISHEFPLGDCRPGRWGLLLDDVRPLTTPVSVPGRQGVWALPDHIAEEVRRPASAGTAATASRSATRSPGSTSGGSTSTAQRRWPMADAWWTCDACGDPIRDDPHTDPATGGDLHEQCCPICRHGRIDTLRDQAAKDGDTPPVVNNDGAPVIGGHPGPTADQAARGETRAATRLEAP